MAGKPVLRFVVLLIWISCVHSFMMGGMGGLSNLMGGMGGMGGLMGGMGGGSGGGSGGGGGFIKGIVGNIIRKQMQPIVSLIVHPDAKPTQGMIDIGFRHRSPPKNRAQLMEYMPHFANLAMNMGVKVPGVSGKPTFQQMKNHMMEKAGLNDEPGASSSGNSAASATSGFGGILSTLGGQAGTASSGTKGTQAQAAASGNTKPVTVQSKPPAPAPAPASSNPAPAVSSNTAGQPGVPAYGVVDPWGVMQQSAPTSAAGSSGQTRGSTYTTNNQANFNNLLAQIMLLESSNNENGFLF